MRIKISKRNVRKKAMKNKQKQKKTSKIYLHVTRSIHLEIHGCVSIRRCPVLAVCRWKMVGMKGMKLGGIKLLVMKGWLMVAAEGVTSWLVSRTAPGTTAAAPGSAGTPAAAQNSAAPAASSPATDEIVRAALTLRPSGTTWNQHVNVVVWATSTSHFFQTQKILIIIQIETKKRKMPQIYRKIRKLSKIIANIFKKSFIRFNLIIILIENIMWLFSSASKCPWHLFYYFIIVYNTIILYKYKY